jgi:tripartite-type tricarboxylate transporter receptor subunit TctC
MVVNNSLPVKSVKEFIAHVKANPGKLSYGSPGNGSTAHLSMELFKSMTGTSIVHIPYKGSAGVLADVMGGQIAVTIDNMPPYIPQVKAGKLRALAVSAAKRSSAMPDLPSIAEAGVPGYDSGAWFGLLAPAGTPKAVVDKLAAETARIIRLPDVNKRVSELGAEPVGGKPEEFAALIKTEIAKWAKVIQDAKVELQ